MDNSEKLSVMRTIIYIIRHRLKTMLTWLLKLKVMQLGSDPLHWEIRRMVAVRSANEQTQKT